MALDSSRFNFIYAVRHTEILCAPERLLDSFDQTTLRYTLLAETLDNPNQTRIREGRLQTFPPRLILPETFAAQELEGFGPQAEQYLDFLRKHAAHIRILRYAYRLRRENYSETVVNEPLETVRDRAVADFKRANDPSAALLQGVDEPWDVCLLHLFMHLVQVSVPRNLEALARRAKHDLRDRVPHDDREEIERAFAAAQNDATLVKPLGRLLKEKGLFDLYQDRFFALIQP